MRNTNLRLSISLLIYLCFLVQINYLNAAENPYGNRIFNLLKIQADKGNTLAQYRIGTYYEFGVSVETNVKAAKVWYKKAADKKYKAATNRLIYLEIKEKGYSNHDHTEWFNDISSGTGRNKADSQIILGQMYHHGIYVKQDLPKALELLKLASISGRAEVESEINIIKSKLAPEKPAPVLTPAPVEKKPEPVKTVTAKVTVKKAKPYKKKTYTKKKINKSKVKTTSRNKSKNKKKTLSEKEKKYKEAMWKLHQENMLLEQTQQWSEGNEDDEEY
ncbi:hypothetical protein MNBD_GAMMA09-2156 [hydrothermal vent metagenome]|uniref:Sel1 repeat family protein n=1 Tax=hydrothermal vent metagenome TaxID=652676 RepID=A0A3B0Y203_9ZZZZ